MESYGHKVSIFYTGCPRSIRRTIHQFRNMIVEPLNATLFIYLHEPTNNYTIRTNTETLIQSVIGIQRIAVFRWMNDDMHLIQPLKHALLRKLSILYPSVYNYDILEYLDIGSGSIVEYMQYTILANCLNEYEKQKTEFDYVLRIRPDMYFCHTFSFAYTTWNETDIDNVLYSLQTKEDSIYSPENVRQLFNTIYSPTKRMKYYTHSRTNEWDESTECFVTNSQNNEIMNVPPMFSNAKEIVDYIRQSDFILIVRRNLFYCVHRKHVSTISQIGLSYGLNMLPNVEYYFDAETQLRNVCVKNKIDYYSSTMQLESDSLYKYTDDIYFENGNIRPTIDIFFFLCRWE